MGTIKYEGFKGFFIMKKDNERGWEYLSSYSRRGEKIYDKYDKGLVRYFKGTTIKSKLPWSVFSMVVKSNPECQVVLYVMIDNKITRVKYFNPADMKITSWYQPEDFYCYIPQKQIY